MCPWDGRGAGPRSSRADLWYPYAQVVAISPTLHMLSPAPPSPWTGMVDGGTLKRCGTSGGAAVDRGREVGIAREFEVDASPAGGLGRVHHRHRLAGCGPWWRTSPARAAPPPSAASSPTGSRRTASPTAPTTPRASRRARPSTGSTGAIEPRDGGRRSWVRYVHSGIFTGDWDSQYEEAGQAHRLLPAHPVPVPEVLHGPARHLHHPRRPGPLHRAGSLHQAGPPPGLYRRRARKGDRVRVDLPGVAPLDAVVDFRTGHFIGLRTDDRLYRFFGRNASVPPSASASTTSAPQADAKGTEMAWQRLAAPALRVTREHSRTALTHRHSLHRH